MKKTFSIFAILAVCLSAFATGNIGPNPPQQGTITYTGLIQTNTVTFAYPFQSVPVLFLQASITNATPLTNTVLTTTNFTVEIAAAPGTGTNFNVNWTAYVGGTRLQYGTNAITGFTPVTNTFNYAYAVAPVVVASGSSTNAASQAVAVSNVTTTNFILTSAISQNASWISVGTVANPASPNTGTFPGQNTIVY